MRQVVLDTETTGLNPEEGHRIIEIGCVELINRRVTDNRFQQYLQPDREIDSGAMEVHGTTAADLLDKPRFADVADDFIAYIQGAELIIHNAAFDIEFLNRELKAIGAGRKQIADYCTVTDTLALARKLHPGQRNSLDALCQRYGVDNSRRLRHGALLDAKILADVYLRMTGGQNILPLGEEPSAMDTGMRASYRPDAKRPPLRVLQPNAAELAEHERRLRAIDEASEGKCLWLRQTQSAGGS